MLVGLMGFLLLVGFWIMHERRVPKDAVALSCSPQSGVRTACETNAVLAETRVLGLKAGFELLRKFYDKDPLLRPDCHAVAMDIGRETYKAFPDYRKLIFTSESAWCNYGFYQEYPNVLLLKTGNIEEARAFCEYAADKVGDSVPGLRAECFRGIGRALPYLRPADQGDVRKMASFAVGTCKQAAPVGEEYVSCLSGSFNQLGRSKSIAEQYLAIKSADPLWLCGEQTDRQAAIQCYGNFKWVVVNALTLGDFKTMLQHFTSTYPAAHEASIRSVIWTLAYEEARKNVSKESLSAEAAEDCTSLPLSSQNDCISGFSVGIAKHGTPNTQHLALISFCKVMAQGMHEVACPSQQAIEYLRGFYTPAHFQEACKLMKSELGIEC